MQPERQFSAGVTPQPLLAAMVRVARSSVGVRLAQGACWSLVGAAISRGMTLAAMIIVARLLGKRAFGEFGMLQSTVLTVATFAGFGLGVTATRHISSLRSTDPERAGKIIRLSAFVALVVGIMGASIVCLSARWIATEILSASHLAPLLALSTPILLFEATNSAQLGALAGLEAFKAIAVASLISGLTSFPLVVLGGWTAGLKGAIGGLATGYLIKFLAHHVALQKAAHSSGIPLRPAGAFKERAVIWRYSLPAVLSSAMAGPIYWICQAIVAHEPDGYAQLGLYTAATHWRAAMTSLVTLMSSAVLPIIASLNRTEDHCRRHHISTLLIASSMTLSAVFAIALIVGADHVAALYGCSYEGLRSIISLTALAAFFQGATFIPINVLLGCDRIFVVLVLNSIWAVTMLVITAHFKASGAMALVSATAGGYGAQMLLALMCAHVTTRPK